MGGRFESLFFYLARAAMILIWLCIIAAFLYSPYLSRFFTNPNSISLYTWADVFDLNHIREFEKESGIKVNVVYYDSCEELISKIEISNGRGYDFLLVNDTNVPDLIKMNVLRPLDRSKINFWHELEPNLLHKYYDPSNIYAVPYSWDVCGLGIDLEKFNYQMPKNSWELIFDHKVALPKIGMMEEGIRSIGIAAQYLYGNVAHVDSEQLNEIKDLLISQKKLVEVYTELLGDYLLYSRASPVVVTPGAFVYRIAVDDEQIKFLIPQEGGFVVSENFVIMKYCQNPDLVYKFLNFMYQKKMVRKFVEKTFFLTARRDVLYEMDLRHLGGQEALLEPSRFEKLGYFKYIAPREALSKIWIEVKAS